MKKIKEIANATIDLKKIIDNKIIFFTLNILWGITVASLTTVLIKSEYSNNVINITLQILSFVIAEILAFKFKILRKIFFNINKTILGISVFIGLCIFYNLSTNVLNYNSINNIQIYIILSIPAIIIFIYWFYKNFVLYTKKYIKSLDKIEKYYLIIGIIILSILIAIVYNVTNVFYTTKLNREYWQYEISYGEIDKNNQENINKAIEKIYNKSNYDVLYTTDSQILIDADVYNNIPAKENDIRQPLFGVFSIPFSIIPITIARILPIDNIYPILLAITQAVLALVVFTLISRLMRLKKISKVLFLVLITVSYTSLLFLLVIEQYIYAVFYMIVYIYMVINKSRDKDITYIMATGSMLTTGILFPFLGNKASIKKSVKNIFYTFLKCLAIFIISARIMLFSPIGLGIQISTVKNFSNINNENNSIILYTNFLKNIYVFSDIQTENEVFASKIVKNDDFEILIKTSRPHIESANTDKISILGITIAILSIIGFLLNRKDKFAQICMTWVIFSFVLLGIIGWGVPENGLILYTFYFGWSFICLTYKAIRSLLKRYNKLQNIPIIVSIITMLVYNFYGIYQIIEFGIKYYS